MKSMEELVNCYFRPGRLPHLWCPGCGNGVILGALLKAIDAEGLEAYHFEVKRTERLNVSDAFSQAVMDRAVRLQPA